MPKCGFERRDTPPGQQNYRRGKQTDYGIRKSSSITTVCWSGSSVVILSVLSKPKATRATCCCPSWNDGSTTWYTVWGLAKAESKLDRWSIMAM